MSQISMTPYPRGISALLGRVPRYLNRRGGPLTTSVTPGPSPVGIAAKSNAVSGGKRNGIPG